MAEERSPQELLAEAIAASGPSVDAEGAMCTGWVVIAEWVGADGQYWMTHMADEQSPSWRTKGLLYNALHTPAGDTGG